MQVQIQVRIVNNLPQAQKLVSEGFCPVECSIGGVSVVDGLMLDHHGEHSHREPVAIRAYRDLYGKRADDPRFIVAGNADADASFAIAALAGIIPHPQRFVAPGTPPAIAASNTQNLIDLATTISRVDVSPIGLDITSMPFGNMLLAWNAMTAMKRDDLGAMAAVGMWRNLLDANPAQLAPYLSAAVEAESNRRNLSLDDLALAESVDRVLVIRGSRVFGFPEWYGRIEDLPFESISGWKNPIVMAWTESGANVTMGCPNEAVAEELFGPGGLKNVFLKLQPAGWGGREAVGGSPRGERLTWEQVIEAAHIVDSLIQQ